MKFSEFTNTVLKNFSSINPSITIKPGNVIRTISPQKTVMAMAKLDDEFPSEACIYDMSRFLSLCSLYKDPEIEFNDNHFIISEDKRKTKYVFADPSMVISPPEKDINLPSEDVTVSVSWDDLQSVIKASGVLQLPEIAFVGADGACSLQAIDSDNPSSDTFGVQLGETDDTFKLIIKTENLRLLPQQYNVTLSSKGISKFDSEKVSYYIAIESKSDYKKG